MEHNDDGAHKNASHDDGAVTEQLAAELRALADDVEQVAQATDAEDVQVHVDGEQATIEVSHKLAGNQGPSTDFNGELGREALLSSSVGGEGSA